MGALADLNRVSRLSHGSRRRNPFGRLVFMDGCPQLSLSVRLWPDGFSATGRAFVGDSSFPVDSRLSDREAVAAGSAGNLAGESEPPTKPTNSADRYGSERGKAL